MVRLFSLRPYARIVIGKDQINEESVYENFCGNFGLNFIYGSAPRAIINESEQPESDRPVLNSMELLFAVKSKNACAECFQ